MEPDARPRREDAGDEDVAERLHWLLRLRWLIVPVFVAVDLAHDLIMNRRAPWSALAVGGVLLVANAIYSALLARGFQGESLLRWARFESALVTVVPVVVVGLHGDPTNPLRYGVLIGVVGAAVVLRGAGSVALVSVWAIVSLIVGDAISMRFDPARLDPSMIGRWVMEAGIIMTVALIAGYLQSSREWTAARLRAARGQIESARRDWEAAFDGLHEVVFVTDVDGRVVRANRAFASLLGARPHELAGRRISELFAGHPDGWCAPLGDGIVEIDDRVFDTVFEVSSMSLGDRTIRFARDVGEERRLHARLVQADKLAAVGVLASGVAHELNNPTAFVTSNLSELRRYVASYEAAIAEMTEIAMEAGLADRLRALLARVEVAFARREAQTAIGDSLEGMERIRQIVTNLRSLARRDQPGEPAAPVELGEVVQTVVRTASSDLRSCAARVDLRGPVWVLGHRGEIVDVVLNLIVNAIQARDETRPNRISVELTREGSSAVLRVSDTGRGMSAAHLKRLFEPFFTTKPPGEGAGLGLSLVRKVVLAHRGSIDVASEPGQGSTFTVRFPLAEPGAVRAASRKDESGAA